MVCFESIYICVALVQSDFIMRVYVPSRSVVSSFVRDHTSALYNVESFAYAQVRFTMACEFMFGAIHTAAISSAVHVSSPGAGHPFHCPVRKHRIRHSPASSYLAPPAPLPSQALPTQHLQAHPSPPVGLHRAASRCRASCWPTLDRQTFCFR